MSPSKQTLRKYGLTADEWQEILDRQGGVCPVCGKTPTTGRWAVDHQHVPKWKQMPPEKRKQYARGLTCWFCNYYYMGKGLTLEKARNVVKYLEDYEKRKAP